MADRVSVNPVIVSCAVRYALGRRSYIVGHVADEVRRTWPQLGDQRAVIREDVRRHIVEDFYELEGEPSVRHHLLDWIDGGPSLWRDLLVWIDRQEQT